MESPTILKNDVSLILWGWTAYYVHLTMERTMGKLSYTLSNLSSPAEAEEPACLDF